MKTTNQRLSDQKEEMEQLRQIQLNHEETKITANLDADVEINDYEAGYVHVRITEKTHIPDEERYEVTERIEKYHPNVFKKLEEGNAFGKKSVKIVHDPSKKEPVKQSRKKEETTKE